MSRRKIKKVTEEYKEDVRKFKKEHGKMGVSLWNGFVQIVRWVFTVMIDFTLIAGIGLYIMPVSCLTIAGMMGVTYDAEIFDVIGVWLVPSAFVIIVGSVITLFICYGVYKSLKKFAGKYSKTLSAEE